MFQIRWTSAVLHGFVDGDVVTYRSTLGDAGGLIDGNDYHVLVVDDQTIKLTTSAPVIADLNAGSWSAGTRTLTKSGTTPIVIDSGLVDGAANTISFSAAHSLVDGDTVTYAYTGDSDDSQLVDGTTYYVLVVDADTIKLLEAAPATVDLLSPAPWSTGTSVLDRAVIDAAGGIAITPQLTRRPSGRSRWRLRWPLPAAAAGKVMR